MQNRWSKYRVLFTLATKKPRKVIVGVDTTWNVSPLVGLYFCVRGCKLLSWNVSALYRLFPWGKRQNTSSSVFPLNAKKSRNFKSSCGCQVKKTHGYLDHLFLKNTRINTCFCTTLYDYKIFFPLIFMRWFIDGFKIIWVISWPF